MYTLPFFAILSVLFDPLGSAGIDEQLVNSTAKIAKNKITDCIFLQDKLAYIQHVTGEQACLCNHFGGAKALFCYVNLPVDNSVEGAKSCKTMLLGVGLSIPFDFTIRLFASASIGYFPMVSATFPWYRPHGTYRRKRYVSYILL